MLYASSLFKSLGYEIELIDLWGLLSSRGNQALEETTKKQRWNVVILEATGSEWEFVKGIFREVKLRGAWTIAVGHQTCQQNSNVYSAPELIDACIYGEYDACITSVVDALLNGKKITLEGVCDQRFGNSVFPSKPAVNSCLDDLPLMDLSNIGVRSYRKISACVGQWGGTRWGFMESSRGCPYSCIFCSPTLRLSYGTHYRYMSPSRIIREIMHMKKELGVNAVSFEDDLFTGNYQYIMDLCDAIIKKRLQMPWVAQTALQNIDTSLAVKMKHAGCKGLCMGIESGSDRILRLSKKGITQDLILQNVEITRRVGIPMTLFFILGFPSETLVEVEATANLVKKLRPLLIQVAFFTPYIGSPWYERHVEKSHAEFHHYNKAVSMPECQVSSGKLRHIQRKIYRAHYCSPQFAMSYLRTMHKSLLTSAHGIRTLIKELRYVFQG